MNETKESTMEAVIVKEVSITDMVVAGKVDALKLYNEGGLDTIIEAIGNEVSKLKPDVTTKKGRDEIKSMAYRVAQSKTVLEKMGKALGSEWAEKVKKLTTSRKGMRERLDVIRDDVRKPLTDWENIEKEKERVLAEEKEAEQQRLREELEAREAEVARKEQAFKEQELKAEAERIQKERDLQVAAEAKVNAEREAQAEIQKQKDIVKKLEIEANLERVRQQDLAAQQQAETARKHQAELDRVNRQALERENQRLAKEDDIRKQEEARLANIEHCRGFNVHAVQCFIAGGMTDECAKLAVKLIVQKKISNVAITY